MGYRVLSRVKSYRVVCIVGNLAFKNSSSRIKNGLLIIFTLFSPTSNHAGRRNRLKYLLPIPLLRLTVLLRCIVTLLATFAEFPFLLWIKLLGQVLVIEMSGRAIYLSIRGSLLGSDTCVYGIGQVHMLPDVWHRKW